MRARLFLTMLGIVLAIYIGSHRTIGQSGRVPRMVNSAGMREFAPEVLEVRPYGPELLGNLYERATGGGLTQEELRHLASGLAEKRGKDHAWVDRFISGYERMHERCKR